MGAGKDRIGAAQCGDEAAGDGIGRFPAVSDSFFAIYFTLSSLHDRFPNSFPFRSPSFRCPDQPFGARKDRQSTLLLKTQTPLRRQGRWCWSEGQKRGYCWAGLDGSGAAGAGAAVNGLASVAVLASAAVLASDFLMSMPPLK